MKNKNLCITHVWHHSQWWFPSWLPKASRPFQTKTIGNFQCPKNNSDIEIAYNLHVNLLIYILRIGIKMMYITALPLISFLTLSKIIYMTLAGSIIYVYVYVPVMTFETQEVWLYFLRAQILIQIPCVCLNFSHCAPLFVMFTISLAYPFQCIWNLKGNN